MMASMAMLQSLLFRALPSVFVTVTTAMTSLGMVNAGVNEMKGKNLQYSKMVGVNSDLKIPSKVGMTLFYLSAFLLSATSFFIFLTSSEPLSLSISSSAFSRYSGVMTMEAVVVVPLSIVHLKKKSRAKKSIDCKYNDIESDNEGKGRRMNC